jgi:hypothetical protein
MNFNFGEVLTRAWQIIWKHKVLWVFGILASCGPIAMHSLTLQGHPYDLGDVGFVLDEKHQLALLGGNHRSTHGFTTRQHGTQSVATRLQYAIDGDHRDLVAAKFR